MNAYYGKKVLVLGYARSGKAAIKLLLKLGAVITLSEAKPKEQIEDYLWLCEMGVRVTGQEKEIFEEDYYKVIKNPGINGRLWFVQRLKERGIPVTTEIELAFEVAKKQHFIAITGSNGKTTTTTLMYEVLKKAYPDKTHLSGNIGIALCETVLENNLLEEEGHYIVLEISNFQLLDIINFSPEIAVIINLSPDHIDFMGSEDAYYRSKMRVYENMPENGVFLYNTDDEKIKEYTSLLPVPCRQVTYSLEDKNADFFADESFVYENGKALFPVNSIKVVGRHNVQNVLVAVSAAKQLGMSTDIIQAAVEEFRGVEHRIEYVREINGVKFYNDSKGTNVDATIIALKAFSSPTILLAGGFEKGLSFEPLKAYLGNVKQVIAFGACGERLVKELTDGTGILVNTLDEALNEAVKIAEHGDVILLSPTTSSFDQYSCFEERGEHFKKLVNEL
ncbi:MAG: UDP-N-acetylmuramoyl-L-alanine--D-glutamate ligase [Clostridia bacterium]|nr:UDP-N-acetylmuramoyl-L-alanine--D-glutamate ligase [Clostridia bacterium]